MATLAEPITAPHRPAEVSPAHWSEGRLTDADLAHIPGDAGPPVIGNLFRMLKDPHGFHWGMFRKYGPVYKNKTIGYWHVMLIGAEANELLLFDRDKNFSSEQGWGPTLHQLFPRGLMLLDFDKHRADRRALSIAFKPEPMRHYADALDRGIAAEVAKWNGTMLFYPAIKQLESSVLRGDVVKHGTRIDGREFRVQVRVADGLAEGNYRGDLELKTCLAEDCLSAIPRGTLYVAYEVKVDDPKKFVLGEWETFQRDAGHTGYVPATFRPSSFTYKWQWRRPTSGRRSRPLPLRLPCHPEPTCCAMARSTAT